MREPWLSKSRTRTDRKLKNRLILAYLALIGVGAAWVYGSDRLPPTWQPYVVPAIAVLVVIPAYWFFLNQKADWSNRATESDEEAREREARRRTLGGD